MKQNHQWANELGQIKQDLEQGTYQPGPWFRLMKKLSAAPVSEREHVSDLVTDVSNLLHNRKKPIKVPFLPGYLAEWIVFVLGIGLLQADQVLIRLGAVALLALCLQPLIKVTTGLLLGVRYSYVYLWYVEPRFKMAYGSYLLCSPQRQCLLHFAGSLGTPVAMLVGAFVLDDQSWLQVLCLAGFVGALGLQIGAFLLVMAGIRKVGPFQLTTLTTPAMLADVYKSAKSR